jgi:hypothetical protein
MAFHAMVVDARKKFIDDIIQRDPTQERFRKGWLNRLMDFQFS